MKERNKLYNQLDKSILKARFELNPDCILEYLRSAAKTISIIGNDILKLQKELKDRGLSYDKKRTDT